VRTRDMLISLAMLAVCAGCSTAVPVPSPGLLLYVTTYDAFNDDWDLYEGELSALVVDAGQNPVLQIGVDDVQEGAFTVLDQQFGNFDLIVDAYQQEGPEFPNAPGFGVLFRHQDNRNYYLFMISGDGYYQVSRRVGGVDEVLSDWIDSPVINQGQAVNTIRVIAEGSAFSFFVNDVQLPLCLTIWNPQVPGECQVAGQQDFSPGAVAMQLVDDTFAQGRIGLGARSFDVGGIVVTFDNLLVCGPQAEPPVPYRCELQLPEPDAS